MTYAVVYSSRTGNTERIARAVREALPAEGCIYFGQPDMEAQKADTVFVGFWADKGECDETVAAFLCSLERKQVVLFGTAGLGGSQTYFDEIADRVASRIPKSCTLRGHFLCQGRMPGGVKRRYEALLADKPDDEKIRAMVENFDRASTHPDEADLEACRIFVRGLLGK